MRRQHNILILALTLGLFACKSVADRQDKRSDKAISADSGLIKNETQPELEIKQVKNFECVRGQAEPVIKKDRYPNTNFILQSDSLTAIETVIFENGDNLTIHNWGCEYYVLTFRFETSKFQHDTIDLSYWYEAAGRLMTGMLAGLDSPIDIKRGLVFLESYYLRDKKNNYKNLKLGEEIVFDDGDIRSFVTLDRIEKISDNKFTVTLSFSTGPL